MAIYPWAKTPNSSPPAAPSRRTVGNVLFRDVSSRHQAFDVRGVAGLAGQNQTSRGGTSRLLRKFEAPMHTATEHSPYPTTRATAKPSRPAPIRKMLVTTAPPSTRMLIAIMACMSVGGGGTLSDHGSYRYGKRARKFSHMAAAVI